MMTSCEPPTPRLYLRMQMPLPGAVWPAIVRYGLRMIELRFERDQAADVEDDGPRPFGFDGRAEAAGAAVVEIGDFDDAAAATAAGEPAVAFGTGERELPHAERQTSPLVIASGDIAADFVDAPVVGGEGIDGVAGELRLRWRPRYSGDFGVAAATAPRSVPR